jgi:hypothetical protein
VEIWINGDFTVAFRFIAAFMLTAFSLTICGQQTAQNFWLIYIGPEGGHVSITSAPLAPSGVRKFISRLSLVNDDGLIAN